MEREGMLEEYRALGVGKETEKLWATEFEQALLGHFREIGVVDSQVMTLIALIKNFQSDDSLLELFSTIESKSKSMDTFTNLRLCEEIAESFLTLKHGNNRTRHVQDRAVSLVSDLLLLAQTNPITVHSYYKTVPHLPQVLEDDQLRQRIAKLAKELGTADQQLKQTSEI